MAMQVYSGPLPLDAVRTLVALAWREQIQYALVEQVDDLQLLGAQRDAAPDPGVWPQGRAFGPDTQVQWEKRGEAFHVVWADAGSHTPPEGLKQSEDNWSGGANQERRYYLWARDDQRTERVLNTERLGIKGRAKLQVREYTDAAGILRFYRYVGLCAEKDRGGDHEPV